MSFSVRLQSNFDAVATALGAKFPIASARALNRAGGSMRTLQAREMSKDLRLKVGTVREELKLTKATKERQAVQLSVSGRRLPVEKFNARGPLPSMGKGRGVRANLPGGRYPHAFRARMPRSGHVGVFQRLGKDRLPIRELFGPSLPQVFRKFSEATLARGHEQLVKNLASETKFLLREVAA